MPYLMARPLVGALDEIRLWVGLFGVAHPSAINFSMGGAPLLPVEAQGLLPIRDAHQVAGASLNHQGVYRFKALGPGLDHAIRVQAGDGVDPYFLRVRSLPAQVPRTLEGSFRIMLVSCYCAETDAVDVGRFVQRLPVRPDISLFAGDQVYLDQPPFEEMPAAENDLRRKISTKYQRNWLSEFTGRSGLQQALATAPAVCVPDDHEFWNNYPWPQFWKKGTQHAPTPTGGLNPWADAALDLFEDFQLGGKPGQATWFRLDIEPLCMLFLDTRSRRRDDFEGATGLMTAAAEQALRRWAQTLLEQQAAGDPRIGVLATGQALFCDPGTFPKLTDAEMANYERQFSLLVEVLDNLAGQGIQVVFLTGDVHWSRVSQAVHARTGRTCLSEVICSPTSLCVTPVLDQWASLVDEVRGIFGTGKTWFRHSKPKAPPAAIGGMKQFRPLDEEGNRWSGNQVAIVEFSRSGRGVEMMVTYYPITIPASPPVKTRRFTLLNT